MPLDEADKKTIGELISAALKENNTELGKQFVTADQATKMVSQGLENGLKTAGLDKVGETLSGLSTKLEELGKGGGEGGGDKGGAGGKGGNQTDPAVAKLQEELETLKRKSTEDAKRAEKAEADRRESQLEAQVAAALSANGIPADRHAPAIAYLKTLRTDDGKPVLGFDDAGNPRFVLQKTGYVDPKSVKDGIAEWAGTDAAKIYKPATDTQGTGEGAGGRGGNRNQGNAPKKADGTTDWATLGDDLQVDMAQIG